MLKGAVVSREEGKRTRTERSRCRGGGARIFVRCSSGCCQTCSRCRQCALLPPKISPQKAQSGAFHPRRSNTESQRLIVQTQFLRNLGFTPKNCVWTSVAAGSHSSLLLQEGPHTGLGPGLVWLQVRTQILFSACIGGGGERGREEGGGQGGLEVSSAPRQVSRPVWASRPVKGLIRDVCFKRRISSRIIDVSTVFGK